MRAKEFILENKKPTFALNEARIAHAEDLIFFEGSAGALRAINSIVGLGKNRDSMSIKWDGSVALVAGRDKDGSFILTDKAGWGAKGYNGHYRSAKEFISMKQSRAKEGADNAAYLERINSLWPIVEKAIPPSFRGFISFDVMWFPGQLQDNGKRYVFTPNTVTYEVDKSSDLGHRVGQGKAGIAAHTFIASPGEEGQPLKNTAGLNVNSDLCILGPEIKNEAPLQQDKAKAKQIIQYVKTNAKAVDGFLDPTTLSELKMTGLPDLLYNFVNQQTRTQDLSLLADKFLPWLQSNPKLSKVMVQKVSDYVRTNKGGLDAIFNIFDAVTYLKLDVINQLESHDGPVISHIAGTRGGEGFVNSDAGGPIKLVNRLGFSASNFGGHE